MMESFVVFCLRRRMAWNRKKGKEDNLLFLDFDGVINTFGDALQTEYETPSSRCMHNLNRLCHDRKLKIVISSSWRYDGLHRCESFLRKGGLDADIPILGMTPMLEAKGRPAEILQYACQEKDLTSMLILDDLSMEYLSAFACQTDFKKGFDDDALAIAEKIRW